METQAGPLLFLDAPAVARALPYAALIDALQLSFAAGDVAVPPRAHHAIEPDNPTSAVLLVMPAWSPRLGVGTKLVTVFPGNARLGLPAVQGLYVLADGATGVPLAVLEGAELTTRRTAAASALASRFLSRSDSKTLLMVGTGRLARELPIAHACVRPIERVLVWGRSPDKAGATAQWLRERGLDAQRVDSLVDGLAQADIVSCATLATEPLVHGDALRPGTHVDLVGSFKPSMREADPRVLERARAVWCDSFDGALHEAGDIVQAIAVGRFAPERLAGDLAALCRAPDVPWRGPDDITVFKSVGLALEDLVAARLCVDGLCHARATTQAGDGAKTYGTGDDAWT